MKKSNFIERITIKRPNAKTNLVIEYDRRNLLKRDFIIKTLHQSYLYKLQCITDQIEYAITDISDNINHYLIKEKTDIEYIIKILYVFITSESYNNYYNHNNNNNNFIDNDDDFINNNDNTINDDAINDDIDDDINDDDINDDAINDDDIDAINDDIDAINNDIDVINNDIDVINNDEINDNTINDNVQSRLMNKNYNNENIRIILENIDIYEEYN